MRLRALPVEFDALPAQATPAVSCGLLLAGGIVLIRPHAALLIWSVNHPTEHQGIIRTSKTFHLPHSNRCGVFSITATALGQSVTDCQCSAVSISSI
jgi:hypothetical protein